MFLYHSERNKLTSALNLTCDHMDFYFYFSYPMTIFDIFVFQPTNTQAVRWFSYVYFWCNILSRYLFCSQTFTLWSKLYKLQLFSYKLSVLSDDNTILFVGIFTNIYIKTKYLEPHRGTTASRMLIREARLHHVRVFRTYVKKRKFCYRIFLNYHMFFW